MMIRCIIEMVPKGYEKNKRIIGIIEIANVGTGNDNIGNYKVVLKKTLFFMGALKKQWRSAVFNDSFENEDIIVKSFSGFDRIKRGPYDLLFSALKACGLDRRNPEE